MLITKMAHTVILSLLPIAIFCRSYSRSSSSSSGSSEESAESSSEERRYNLISSEESDESHYFKPKDRSGKYQKIPGGDRVVCSDPWEVYFEEKEACVRLAVPPQYSSVCGSEEWLVLDEDEKPHCEEYPCETGQLPYLDGECVDNHAVCPDGMMLYVTRFGEAVCDCLYGYAYWEADDRCYKLYDRGPCPQHYELVYLHNKTQCLYNPCHRENYIYITDTGECYKLHSQGPCQKDHILTRGDDLHRDGGAVRCVPSEDRTGTSTPRSVGGSIIVAPLLRCYPGFKMRTLGRCSEVHTPCPGPSWLGVQGCRGSTW